MESRLFPAMWYGMFHELMKVWRVKICRYHDVGNMADFSQWAQWLHSKISCVWIHVCGYMCTCTFTQESVFRSHVGLHTLFETESFTSLEFCHVGYTCWLESSQRSTCLWLPSYLASTRNTGVHHLPGCLHGFWGLEPRFSTLAKQIVLLTELSPQPLEPLNSFFWGRGWYLPNFKVSFWKIKRSLQRKKQY